MKHLANCTPREFLAQSVKAVNVLENWLKVTGVMEIRKNKPDIPKGADKNIREEMLAEQGRKNLIEMFNAAAMEHPEETLELLGTLCFVEPEHIDDYPMDDYMGALFEMVSSKTVTGFFTSSARLGRLGILKA